MPKHSYYLSITRPRATYGRVPFVTQVEEYGENKNDPWQNVVITFDLRNVRSLGKLKA